MTTRAALMASGSIVLLALIVGIAASQTSQPITSSGQVEIQLLDFSGAFVVNAKVSLSDANHEIELPLDQAFSDFRAENVAAGTYELNVVSPRFKSPAPQKVDVSAGKLTKLRVDMVMVRTMEVVPMGGPKLIPGYDAQVGFRPEFDLMHRMAPTLDVALPLQP
jgi:hypothetical protein